MRVSLHACEDRLRPSQLLPLWFIAAKAKVYEQLIDAIFRGKEGAAAPKRSLRRFSQVEWIDEQVRQGKFKDFNQAIDVALERLRGSEKE